VRSRDEATVAFLTACRDGATVPESVGVALGVDPECDLQRMIAKLLTINAFSDIQIHHCEKFIMQLKPTSPSNKGIVALYDRAVNSLDKMLSHDVLALVSRAAIAGVFWLSGRTKVDGILNVNETALALFQDEYKLPIIPSE
jgi:hypothetical protein